MFAKAGSDQNDHALRALRREAEVLARLPVAVPAPRLLGGAAVVVDDRPWQVVVMEHVPGRVPLPWTERSLAAAHDACLRVVRELGPPPSELCDSSLSASLRADAVDAYLAYVVSSMLSRADAPLWPGVRPAVRVHQRRYARLFADWLGARRGWLPAPGRPAR